MNLLLTIITAIFLSSQLGALQPQSALERLVEPYRQDIVRWEMSNFFDKWLYQVTALPLRRDRSPEARMAATRRFFELGESLRVATADLERAIALAPASRAGEVGDAQAKVQRLQRERAELRPLVEETLEAAISAVAAEQGVINQLGPLRWPPVDFAFEPGALLLVRSPRDEIRRLTDVLLRPDVDLLDQEALEEGVEAAQDVAALVVRLGGIATYPAQVTPNASLHGTLVLASHEWLHHWLFFRPLGRTWFQGGAMRSINETVADIVGEELGDQAFERLTGQRIERPPWEPPTLRPREEQPPGVFDFQREMRATRIQLEALLAEGKVEEAESYLEERRLLFVENGHFIRKLNTAYFAFYGTYADSPASISPIAVQLRTIRAVAPSLAAFLDQVSGITAPSQLEALAREAGWEGDSVTSDKVTR